MNLSEKQLEVISRAAAQAAFEHLEEERKKHEKQKHDRRLRNIKLLLRNYRAFVVHCADIKLEINELNAKLELDELDTDEFAVMSILKSKKRTLAMVKYINKTLEVYKLISEKSDDTEEARRYQVIHDMYISDLKNTVKEISERHSVHSRTIYKDVDKACETLVVLMFGVDGIRFK
ncbi:MAG: hypothetical protein ACQEXE_10370 [Bacillota bacterium]|uniref:hypothetical protein n=1 Tax=Cytobacillus firmus TaxID=1399 RepID=UPI0018CF671B|nr:hypothetical protein [Cytobacillus firmus]MBG9603947.1 hypothetical protein [Cytobacillus firmus]MBG9656073.1 hypothetical protein [Cytobacillus firmus]MED1907856.1 hypothetical protein [Cytobacillus firmus]